jgi:precorrin-2/cobalt-factor-2 C20-methyltransferase
LYGVGVGPGDPGLMTLKAVDTIRRCPVVAAPRSPSGGMVALDIVRRAPEAVDLADKEILPLDFEMTRDAAVRAHSHCAAAGLLRARLDAGQSVALLNLGDVSVYATFGHIAALLAPAGYSVEMIAGVPSFCAAAALLGESLTSGMTAPLRVIPDSALPDDAPGPNDFRAPGTTVWMKSGRALPALLAALAAANLSDRVAVVQNCGLPGERVLRGLREAKDIDPSYFTLVILKNPEESA